MTNASILSDLNLLHLDGTQIAELIREKTLTIEEITIAHIQHIKNINKELNAVVEDRFEEALKEAKEKDNNIEQINFNEQPLYGVPISIKESFHVKGMKTTGGVYHRKDIMRNKDAVVVKKLKDSGAIILCKTNTPTLCFCHETDNKLYGRTNNAWDKTRTAGGSSGGEAALIAVGGSPVGMSSDIGGSIRFPSHFNGVVGFKPGMNQVSSEGHIPADNIPLKARMSSIGPIGKSVRDVKLLYHLTKNTEENVKTLFEKVNVEVLPNDNGYPLSNETANNLKIIYQFIETKYNTSLSVPPFFNESAQLWQEIMSIDGGKEIKELAFNTDRINTWKQYIHEKVTGKTNTHNYLTWALIGANLFKPSQKRKNEIQSIINDGDIILERYFKNKLLIFPVYHQSAPLHGHLYKEIFSINKTYKQYMPYIAYANVWGLPSLTLPVGFDQNYLPIGIQIMSINSNVESIFTLGEQLENEFGGFKRSTIYD